MILRSLYTLFVSRRVQTFSDHNPGWFLVSLVLVGSQAPHLLLIYYESSVAQTKFCFLKLNGCQLDEAIHMK